jgi:CDP-diacylglycerol---serine O-phosphatidyltransferase
MKQNQDPHLELAEPAASSPKNRARAHKIVALVPNMLTLGAVLCGLTAIRLAGEGQYHIAMAAIFGAVLLDVADGFAARRLAAETAIGAELDSLADFLNFGVAPAMLLYNRDLYLLGGGGWLVAAMYVVATGLRLARFNVHSRNNWQEPDKKCFSGLPSTGAAMGILSADAVVANLGLQPRTVPALVAVLAIAASALMLSKLRVPSLPALFNRIRARISKR